MMPARQGAASHCAACTVVTGEPHYGTTERFARRRGYEYRLWTLR